MKSLTEKEVTELIANKEMEFVNQVGNDNWQELIEESKTRFSNFSKRELECAERWAKLMQIGLRSRNPLKSFTSIAGQSFWDAIAVDPESRHSYGWIGKNTWDALASVWKHGEQLRRWRHKEDLGYTLGTALNVAQRIKQCHQAGYRFAQGRVFKIAQRVERYAARKQAFIRY